MAPPKETKLKDLNIRIGEKEKQRFIDKCETAEPKINYSEMIRQWVNQWVKNDIPGAGGIYTGDFAFKYEDFDCEAEAKNKILNLRVSDEERKNLFKKCNEAKPVRITYAKLIRLWINNWVERGDPAIEG